MPIGLTFHRPMRSSLNVTMAGLCQTCGHVVLVHHGQSVHHQKLQHWFAVHCGHCGGQLGGDEWGFPEPEVRAQFLRQGVFALKHPRTERQRLLFLFGQMWTIPMCRIQQVLLDPSPYPVTGPQVEMEWLLGRCREAGLTGEVCQVNGVDGRNRDLWFLIHGDGPEGSDHAAS